MNHSPTVTDDVIDVLRVEIRKVKDSLPVDVAADALLMTDLGLDSLDVVEFVARVEEVYRVSVPDEDWQRLRTLDCIADYVRTHR
jgi:acyl carrier protein